MKSYINLFRNYANFKGFLKRGPFWTAILIHRLIQIAVLAPWIYTFFNDSFKLPGYYFYWVLPLLCMYTLLSAVPILAACFRRMRTLPRNVWWLLVGFIPVAGWFIVLIWMLQKGNYDDFERKMRLAGASSNQSQLINLMLKAAEKPRMGGWFFVALLILAAGGWFLNREIMKAGPHPVMLNEIRAALPENVSAVLFRGFETGPDEKAGTGENGADQEETSVPDAPTAAPTATPIPYVRLRPAENNPVFNLKNGNRILPVGEDLYVSGYAVSVGNYRECVRDGVCAMPAELNSLAYRGLVPEGEDPSPEAEVLPMVFVTRDHAAVYCEWAGMRLPTADEWKAAAGTPETPYSPENANCVGTDRKDFIKSADQIALTVPVTAFAGSDPDAGPVQMAGNVWEWTAGDEDAKTETALGGGWNSYPETLGADAVMETLRGYAADNIGFRCFVDAENVTEEFFEGGEPVPEIIAEEITEEPAEAAVEEAAVEEAVVEEAAVEDAAVEEAADVLPAEEAAEEPAAEEAAAEETAAEETPAEETAPVSEGSGSGDGSGSTVMTRPQDNARMVLIPAGSFNMGVQNSAVDEKPVHEVKLSAFWMDAYEVTNAQYALCVAEGVCSEPHEKKSFRRASYYGEAEFDSYPVIYVDWQQANDYCAWTGSRLPTEAQWEYAAKGTEDNRYPWGQVFDSAKLNYSGNGNYDTLPVDGTPDDVSAFGVYNLGGNVSEWVYDRYQENWYSVTNQPEDPTGPENGQFRVIRGGSAQTGENNARTADRFYARDNSYNLDRGFRCVRPD